MKNKSSGVSAKNLIPSPVLLATAWHKPEGQINLSLPHLKIRGSGHQMPVH